MKIETRFSRAGEPVGYAQEAVVVEKAALRVSPRGAVYIYVQLPIVITDDEGKPLIRTTASGSMILRAAPVLE